MDFGSKPWAFSIVLSANYLAFSLETPSFIPYLATVLNILVGVMLLPLNCCFRSYLTVFPTVFFMAGPWRSHAFLASVFNLPKMLVKFGFFIIIYESIINIVPRDHRGRTRIAIKGHDSTQQKNHQCQDGLFRSREANFLFSN